MISVQRKLGVFLDVEEQDGGGTDGGGADEGGIAGVVEDIS